MQQLYNSNDYPIYVDICLDGIPVTAVEIPATSTVGIPLYGDITCHVTPLPHVPDQLTTVLLSEEQRTHLERRGYLEVKSRLHYGVTYHVYPGYAATEIWRRGQRVASACLMPKDTIATSDYLFMRLLLLEGDERSFLRQAYIFRWSRSNGRPRTGLDWITFYQSATA